MSTSQTQTIITQQIIRPLPLCGNNCQLKLTLKSLDALQGDYRFNHEVKRELLQKLKLVDGWSDDVVDLINSDNTIFYLINDNVPYVPFEHCSFPATDNKIRYLYTHEETLDHEQLENYAIAENIRGSVIVNPRVEELFPVKNTFIKISYPDNNGNHRVKFFDRALPGQVSIPITSVNTMLFFENGKFYLIDQIEPI